MVRVLCILSCDGIAVGSEGALFPRVALQTRARTRRLNPIFCEWGSVCIALQLIYVKFDDGGHQKALDRVESQKT